MEEKLNLTILIVDDNPVSVNLLEKVLLKEGYQVITANDGPTARKLSVEKLPDPDRLPE